MQKTIVSFFLAALEVPLQLELKRAGSSRCFLVLWVGKDGLLLMDTIIPNLLVSQNHSKAYSARGFLVVEPQP